MQNKHFCSNLTKFNDGFAVNCLAKINLKII